MKKHAILLVLTAISFSCCVIQVPQGTCIVDSRIRKEIAKSLWLFNTKYYRKFYTEHSKVVQEVILNDFGGQTRVLVYEAHYHPTFQIFTVVYSTNKATAFTTTPGLKDDNPQAKVIVNELPSYQLAKSLLALVNGDCMLWQKLASSYFIHATGVESVIFEATCPNKEREPCFLFLGSGELGLNERQ